MANKKASELSNQIIIRLIKKLNIKLNKGMIVCFSSAFFRGFFNGSTLLVQLFGAFGT